MKAKNKNDNSSKL